jgi:crotonobetainyl-CoA hydratase
VTGAGDRAFCAGSDLKAISGGERGEYPANGYAGIVERFDLYKPIIAAVNGACLGGGFEIALACDIIIASDNAYFGLPEPRVGAIALGGGVHRLVRQIGMKRAMTYLLTCARIPAHEALALGLVSEVTAPAALTTAVERCCAQILAAAPPAIRATKETALRGLAEPSVQAAMQRQADYPGFKAWRAAEDTKEGPRAFAEKRTPHWRGF